jgi:hypothetical protein
MLSESVLIRLFPNSYTYGDHPTSCPRLFSKTFPYDERSVKLGIGILTFSALRRLRTLLFSPSSLEMPRNTVHTLRFPESFSRTSPLHDVDPMSDASLDITPPNERVSYMFPMQVTMAIGDDRSPSPPLRSSKSSVMKLEHILNDVSIDCGAYSRSRSLCGSPMRSDAPFEVSVQSFSLNRC